MVALTNSTRTRRATHRFRAAAVFLSSLLISARAMSIGAQVSPPTTSRAGAEGQPTARKMSRGVEDAFLAIEQSVPGFGGMYRDSLGAINYFIVDPANAPAAEAAIREKFGFSGNPNGPNRLVMRQGQYGFSQLVEWQTRIRKGATLENEVRLLDADESINRVRMYVRSDSALARVPALASRLDIPLDAIKAEVNDFQVDVGPLIVPRPAGVH